MPLSPSHWHRLGGVVCLDFANTKSRNPDENAFDLLWDYTALLQWGMQLGLLTQLDAETQLELAGGYSDAARMALERALGLREAIYAAFTALTEEQPVPGEVLATINAGWAEAMSHLQVSPDGEKLGWKWVGIEGALGSVLWPVAKSAAELLVSDNLARVKRCGGCGWLFLDTTRDSRRRWCDMKICGNRAKARRHYDRKHAPLIR
jgi:predicted RNA-binding Zn ribbon-like protein